MTEPVINDNWTIEDEYRSRMNALEPYERVDQMVGMFNWTRNDWASSNRRTWGDAVRAIALGSRAADVFW